MSMICLNPLACLCKSGVLFFSLLVFLLCHVMSCPPLTEPCSQKSPPVVHGHAIPQRANEVRGRRRLHGARVSSSVRWDRTRPWKIPRREEAQLLLCTALHLQVDLSCLQNRSGGSVAPTLQWPDKSLSLGLVQALSWRRSGLMLQSATQIRQFTGEPLYPFFFNLGPKICWLRTL
jgi:hypothetical protein